MKYVIAVIMTLLINAFLGAFLDIYLGMTYPSIPVQIIHKLFYEATGALIILMVMNK